jgi:hypothetical protein
MLTSVSGGRDQELEVREQDTHTSSRKVSSYREQLNVLKNAENLSEL